MTYCAICGIIRFNIISEAVRNSSDTLWGFYMAEKDTKSKTTAKSSTSAKTTVKPAVKSTSDQGAKAPSKAAAKSATPAKAATKSAAQVKSTAKPANSTAKSSSAQSAAKSTSKSATSAKQSDKSATSSKSTDKTAASAKPEKTSVKPAAKSAAESAAKDTQKKSAAVKGAKQQNVGVTADIVVDDIKENNKKSVKSSETESAKENVKSSKSEPAKGNSTKDEGDRTESESDKRKEDKPEKKGSSKISEITEEKRSEKSDGAEKKSKKSSDKDSKNNNPKKEVRKSKPSKDSAPEGDEKKKKMLTVVISAVSIVLMIAIVLGIVIGVKSCNNKGLGGVGDALSYPYKATTPIGFYGQVLGTTERVKPVAEIRNEGLSEYPKYGYTLGSVLGTDDDKVAARNALISESRYLTSENTRIGSDGYGGGGYTWMDKNGYLYSGTTFEPIKTLDSQGNHRQLYKHTAAVGLYGGDVSDDEPAIVKQVTLRPRGYSSYSVTGVYAPAGEVIKIEIPEKDMDATGGIAIHIGQALYNGKANNIWTAKNQMQRFPVILNTMVVNKDTSTYENGVYTAYVGSFVGGPLYIRNTLQTVKVTISGGVKYSHFILGYTTPEEFAENWNSSAPYFDLEVWNYGVLHSGPKQYAKAFSYDDLYKAAVLWEKVSLVSTTNRKQGIVFLYDPFVAAGAAVAFPGQGSVNCPAGWMAASLNYSALVTSGSWGNFHEYHHNFQNYGVGAGGEVTNNGMTLVSYALFTKISAARSEANFGATGLGGWNRYMSAPWALEQAMRIGRPDAIPENGDRGLSLYATLLHSFGADNYMQAKVTQQKTAAYHEDYAGYLQAWQDITHNNMSYYFNKILNAGLGNTYDNADYPMYVPVATTYQTGRGYNYDGVKKYINTMQPYVITHGEEFILDLRRYEENAAGQYVRGSMVLPEDFNYTIKNITNPEFGEIEKIEEGVYKYKPDPEHARSGKIILTLGLSKADPNDATINFKLEDVDIVIELEQSREKNKYVLNRTTYEYEAGKAPTDARTAYTDGYAGHINKIESDNINPTQNSNTDVWYDYGENQAPLNTVVEVRGKIYVEEGGKYRLALRGRYNLALYVSLDGGKTYELAAFKDTKSTANGFDFNDPNTYKDYELAADTWVYFKEVMINSDKRNSFIGLGWGMFIPPQGVIDEDGNLIGGTEEKITVHYATAYRESYEFQSEFTSDYLYKWEAKQGYSDNRIATVNKTVIDTNYKKEYSWNWNNYPTENLSDDKTSTYIHTGYGLTISEDTPLFFTFDLGEVKPVNSMTIFSQYRPNGDYMVPTSYNLYGSIDGSSYSLIGEFVDIPRTGSTSVVDFEETNIRYYKLEITKSTGRFVIIGDIQLMRKFELTNGDQFAPSNTKFKYEGKWNLYIASSTFGSVYVGAKGSKMNFEFEGTRFVIMSSKNFGSNYEVYVDGKRVQSVPPKEDESDYRATFVTYDLGEGKHSVSIVCSGEASIDSIITFT